MKRIPLTRGLFALVDDADFEWLSRWKWRASRQHHKFRAARDSRFSEDGGQNGKRRMVFMHREILGLSSGDKRQVDHINGDPLDNRRTNLRLATNQQNQWNRKPPQGTSSRYKGVWWDKCCQRWRARVAINGRNIHLGCFGTEEQAAQAYNRAARQYHGEYAWLNDIGSQS